MHPSYFPFIVNGPPCTCTCARVEHVGVRYGLPATDQGCSACAVCERYTPVEAIDHDLEVRQRDEIVVNERRRTAIHKRVVFASLVPLVLLLPAALWAPRLVPWLIMIVVSVNVGNVTVSQVYSWRVGDLRVGEAVMQLVAAAGLVGFFVALFTDARFVAYALLMIALGCSVGVGLITQSSMKRDMRAMAELRADLRNLNEPDA